MSALGTHQSKRSFGLVMLGLGNWVVIRLCKVGVRNQQNLYPRIPTTDVAKLL